MYQSNTLNFNMLFYYLGQHVSILTESSSGPSKIQILIIMFKMHCGIPNAYILDITMYKIQLPLVLIIQLEYIGSKILTGTYKGS